MILLSAAACSPSRRSSTSRFTRGRRRSRPRRWPRATSLPPRHLETLLQALVRAGILKGVRGPRGGYELARERRRITVGEIVAPRPAGDEPAGEPTAPSSRLVEDGRRAGGRPRRRGVPRTSSTQITVDDLCRSAEDRAVFGDARADYDFTI